MAILKHISSKSADYGRVMEYLMFEQNRLKNESRRDKDGNLVMRQNMLIDSLECEVGSFAIECRELNESFKKNLSYKDVKSHHYIISFDPKDSYEGNLSIENAQKIGMDFARKNFPGHQAVVCTHADGENHSGNIHVHIIINSLRKRDVDRQSFMERRSDSRAGFKHHLTDKYLAYLKDDLMQTCKKEKLHQVDLLSPAKKKVTEREYWADVRGKIAEGPDFKNRKDMLRSAIEDIASKCTSEKEFAAMLKNKYGIVLKISRGRYSYLMPDREKAIRGKMLGTDYTEEFLRIRFRENAKDHYPKAFTMRSDLPFVRDLQTSAISSVNRAYDRNQKVANLKQMADTIMYMETHNIQSREALDQSYDALHSETVSARQALKRSEDGIKALNEQIHYTGQYLANKSAYAAYMKEKNKGQFRSEHEAEIILYEAARKYLKDHANDGTLPSLAYVKTEPSKFPNISRVKAIRSDLIAEQRQLRECYYSARDAEKELYAIKRNVDAMLQEPHLDQNRRRKRQHEDKLE